MAAARLNARHRAAASDRAAVRIVLLPPAAAVAADYVAQGFAAALAASAVPAQLLLPELPAAEYARPDFEQRLVQQVLLPAQHAGEGRVRLWLGGISLGAMAALRCAAAGLVPLAGVCALAPWPGPRPLWQQHRSVAQVRRWAAADGGQEAAADERVVWRWLGRGGTAGLPVWIGHGHADRFVDGQALLAGLRPPRHRCVVEGGHDWPTWRALWRSFLTQGPWLQQAGTIVRVAR
ncbi:MAG: hypothetical protein ACK5TK_16030 [Betaproteobacteria bacterium]